MERAPFQDDEIAVVGQAIEISEDLISDFYKISTSEWKRCRYDIQSLQSLHADEITDAAFAQIRRYACYPGERLRGSEPGDYFKICLQDHRIREAIARDSRLHLFPFATYIVTHELIHVVRFSKFIHRFHTSEREIDAEEQRVHALTCKVLSGLKIKGMGHVVDVFQDSRAVEDFSEHCPACA
jgi:hypothetical protein